MSYSVMPPSRLRKHTHKLATDGSTCFNKQTLSFHFYDMALGLQQSCSPLTNGCGGPNTSTRPALLPCYTGGKLHQRLLPKTMHCQDSICRHNMWWLSRPQHSQEETKKDTVTEDENKFMQADNKKNITNPTPTRQ